MTLEVSIELEYKDNHWFRDGLYLIAIFKEPRKTIKTRISETVIDYKNPDQFCDDLLEYFSDIEKIKKDAEGIVRDYFKRKVETLRKNGRIKEVEKMIEDFNKRKIKIKVEI